MTTPLITNVENQEERHISPSFGGINKSHKQLTRIYTSCVEVKPSNIEEFPQFKVEVKGISVMKEYMSILEGLVEQLTLGAILEMLERICHKKAENLRTHWNDEESAKRWDKAARQIENINVDI